MAGLDRLYQGKILNFAHRGASGHAPQNTLSAFVLAAEMGADGIELDVHLSRDGHVVVIHDDTVDATTDGSGRVSQMTLSELESLDAGEWFDRRFAGERIPTLQQVFDAVGDRLLINIEIKVERGYHPVEQEASVVELVQENGLQDRVILSSFTPSSLRRVHEMAPDIPLGFLYGKPEPAFLPGLVSWLVTPFEALHPEVSMVHTRYVSRAHRRGKRINVWTVNHEDDMRRMRDLSVDGIITNYPDRLRRILAENESSGGS